MATALEEGLVSFICSDAAVTAFVAERVSRWSAQGEVLPRVTYDIVTVRDEQSVNVSTGQPVATIRVTVWGQTASEARAISRLLRNSQGGGSGKRLREFQGSMGGVWVQSCRVENEQDVELPSPLADGRPLIGVSFDLVIGFIEQ